MAFRFTADPYHPLDTLKAVDTDIWIVDGPVITLSWVGLPLPFPTRMTVVRLEDGGLWIHSPTELTPELQAEIDALGPVRYLVAPNRIHYWWVPDWQAAYPDAVTYAAPRVAEQAAKQGRDLTIDAGLDGDLPWAGEIESVTVPGHFMTEVDFFHKASRTLILTDLIENFEAEKIHGPVWRWLARLTGVVHPHGSLPIDLRMTFRRHKADVRRAAETMIAWNPVRIILAHGKCYSENAVAELERAFRWTGLKGQSGDRPSASKASPAP